MRDFGPNYAIVKPIVNQFNESSLNGQQIGLQFNQNYVMLCYIMC
jgi:hypothetical protein